MARGIFSILETSLSDTRHMYDCLTKLLEEEASLLAHLDSCGGVQCPQYQQLWRRGLAGVFQPSLLARLWDKLIGGSSKVLAYVLACALFRYKYRLFTLMCYKVKCFTLNYLFCPDVRVK